MTEEELELILGRKESPLNTSKVLEIFDHKRILITGAKGSLGEALQDHFVGQGSIHVFPTDIEDCDVTNNEQLFQVVADCSPHYIFHLAGAKHAGSGEDMPTATVGTNTLGTLNVISAARQVGVANLILASTCKACDPQTVYGASKLIAERMVLNVGGAVARFFNVVETSENVFELWEKIQEYSAIPYTECLRYFISKEEAVSLLLWTAFLGRGRYIYHPGNKPRAMKQIAQSLYPTRELISIPPRRGDRYVEPICGSGENILRVKDALHKVVNIHD